MEDVTLKAYGQKPTTNPLHYPPFITYEFVLLLSSVVSGLIHAVIWLVASEFYEDIRMHCKAC